MEGSGGERKEKWRFDPLNVIQSIQNILCGLDYEHKRWSLGYSRGEGGEQGGEGR